MKRKCRFCGSALPGSQIICKRCAAAESRLSGTCTGVKYPCSFHCKRCYYDRMYNAAKKSGSGLS